MSSKFKIRTLRILKSGRVRLNICMRLFFTITLASALFLSSSSRSYANEQSREYKVKIAYLYNFTKFVSWPDDILTPKDDTPLNICIFGKSPFGQSIDLLVNKTVQGHSVNVKNIDVIKEGQNCHVIYITKSKEKDVDNILRNIADKNILTVSDIDEFAAKGGCISLSVLKGKIKFNVNLRATDGSDLKVSAKLLELAKVVIE